DSPVQGPAADRDTLYAGIAGLAPVLAEIGQYRELSGPESALASGIVARLSATAPTLSEASLYDGLAGHATALRLLSHGAESVALQRLADLQTPDGWPSTVDVGPERDSPLTDIVMGTAGTMLTAAWAGASPHIVSGGAEALLRVAEPTEAGLDWRMFPGYRSSSPNFSHGTAGVASALAIAGHLLGRGEFVDAAVRGARHLLAVG